MESIEFCSLKMLNEDEIVENTADWQTTDKITESKLTHKLKNTAFHI